MLPASSSPSCVSRAVAVVLAGTTATSPRVVAVSGAVLRGDSVERNDGVGVGGVGREAEPAAGLPASALPASSDIISRLRAGGRRNSTAKRYGR